MASLSSLLLLCGASRVLAQTGAPGGYSDVAVGANETALLSQALANDALYGASVATRVCFTAIDSLQQQTVAGVNYRFTVSGCEVATAKEGEGKCPSAVLSSCTPAKYVVTVFDQPWTNTTQVSSIETVSGGSASSTHGSHADDHQGSLGSDSQGDSSVKTTTPTTRLPSPSPSPTSAGNSAIATAVAPLIAIGLALMA